jgi:hypothetical protein
MPATVPPRRCCRAHGALLPPRITAPCRRSGPCPRPCRPDVAVARMARSYHIESLRPAVGAGHARDNSPT